jgi:cytochrome P450
MGSKGVFAAEGDEWRRWRRLAVTALNSNHLRRYYDVVRVATERLRERLVTHARTGRPVAISDEFKTFTMDVTVALAFGCDLATDGREAQLRQDIDHLFTMTARRMSAPFPYWRYVRLPGDRELERAVGRLREVLEEYVAQARARMHARPELREKPENFLESMLATQDTETPYSEDELFGNALTMLLAGVDTTALTLAWTSWFLARDPSIQDRLAREAAAQLGEERIATEYASAADASYAEAVLKESLRMKPAGAFVVAESISSTVIADVRIPAGTRLLLLTRYAAMQESAFARPEVFDPNRWLGEQEGPGDTKAFLPFGAGPRFCPGRNLALLEAKAALVMLMRNFEVRLQPGAAPVKERLAFTVGPDDLQVRLEER